MGKLQDCPFHLGKIAQQKVVNEDGLLFPMVLLPQDVSDEGNTLQSFLHTIESNREWIDDHLKKVGALLFRGFPLKSASDFNAVMEAFGWDEMAYLGAASRIRVEGRVFTANEAPLHQPIKFHHEMALFEDFPTKLAFYCEIAPPDGGQTAILLSHKITERMEEKYPEFVTKLEKEGLIYSAIFPADDDPNDFLIGWQTLYKTKDKEEAQRKALDGGLKISKLTWDGNKMTFQIEASDSMRIVDGDKKAWFNLLTFNDLKNAPILGDGSVIPKEVIESCLQIAEEEAIEVKWEVADVVVLDNRFVMHARRPSKPPRRILAAFCK
ncbi:hypothetical protein SUGI_0868260 [Cryptomeria japonica]|uniref:clavaminate synthase-like protein At3g21360 n=1 Tax=Cryptomeria japonica TaxID=3369 RepID=UPI002414AFA7|nr:clavaminate synthase-like protein At3g21360 [Cryptomeria japonica]GLJ41937.1 hypothetical protein SUGI_0868260 [Cryptomeria japonica]